jgi:hypothetical protein
MYLYIYISICCHLYDSSRVTATNNKLLPADDGYLLISCTYVVAHARPCAAHHDDGSCGRQLCRYETPKLINEIWNSRSQR